MVLYFPMFLTEDARDSRTSWQFNSDRASEVKRLMSSTGDVVLSGL
jgi:hypothetical protein